MPMRKETPRFARLGIKDCWHPYGLQGLSPEKFATVTSLILKGKFSLLDLKGKQIDYPKGYGVV
jgi:hypothetical protein